MDAVEASDLHAVVDRVVVETDPEELPPRDVAVALRGECRDRRVNPIGRTSEIVGLGGWPVREERR
jgi:hypothetical protein